MLRLVIGLKDSRQFFNQSEAKPLAPCTCDFSRASSEFQVIARNSDWFMALFVPVVIGQSDYFGFGFFESHLKTALSMLSRVCVCVFFFNEKQSLKLASNAELNLHDITLRPEQFFSLIFPQKPS